MGPQNLHIIVHTQELFLAQGPGSPPTVSEVIMDRRLVHQVSDTVEGVRSPKGPPPHHYTASGFLILSFKTSEQNSLQMKQP